MLRARPTRIRLEIGDVDRLSTSEFWAEVAGQDTEVFLPLITAYSTDLGAYVTLKTGLVRQLNTNRSTSEGKREDCGFSTLRYAFCVSGLPFGLFTFSA